MIKEFKCFIMTDSGPNMEMTKRMLEMVSAKEEEMYRANLDDYYKSLLTVAKWNSSQAVSEEEKELTKKQQSEVFLLDSSTSFESYRRLYYQVKMGIDPTEGSLAEASGEYFKGLVWVMKYYYGDCISWSWIYPYHYSPLASDIAKYLK